MRHTEIDIRRQYTQNSDKGVHTEVLHPHRPRETRRFRRTRRGVIEGRDEQREGDGGLNVYNRTSAKGSQSEVPVTHKLTASPPATLSFTRVTSER
jgi:hypothetical protein